MKHVWIAVDQSPVECNGQAVILGIFRKRKAAKRAAMERYETFPIAAKRKGRWATETGHFLEISYWFGGTRHYPGVEVFREEVR